MEANIEYSRVTVHPLALLSVVDHYNRVNKDVAPHRVVGILLGQISHGTVDVLNCYAVPFEEEGDVWFFDHNYHEQMARMCRKVNGLRNHLFRTQNKRRPHSVCFAAFW